MQLIREVLRETKAAPKVSDYFQIELNDDDALRIFGSCVFDPYSKVLIDDDHKVIFLREIFSCHAQEINALGVGLDFDFCEYRYFFLTSSVG